MDENTQQPQQQVPLQPIQQASESTPKKSVLPKILLIIVGVSVILGLIGGAYYLGTKNKLSQQPSHSSQNSITSPTISTSSSKIALPTSFPILPVAITRTPNTYSYVGWKTYKNSSFGYSLQYPSDWILDASRGELDQQRLKNDPVYAANIPAYGGTSIKLTDPQGDVLELDYDVALGAVPPHVYNYKTVFIDEQPLIKAYNDTCNSGTVDCRNKKTDLYMITYGNAVYENGSYFMNGPYATTDSYNWSTGSKAIPQYFENLHGKPAGLFFTLKKQLPLDDSHFQQTDKVVDQIIASLKFPH